MSLITDILSAQAEGLIPNAERFVAFLGPGPIELQILGGKERYAENKYAHARHPQDAVRLFEVAEKQSPTGIYVVLNEPDEAVTARSEPGQWHAQKKGEATTDADIVARRCLFVDIDWARARGTSTTDEHCALALEGAATVYSRLAQAVPTSSLGFGHSGNCGSVLVALDRLEETPLLALTIKEILYCLHVLFTDPRIQADKNTRNGIEIDTSVCDAKRLGPAYGTTKRKGAANNKERPHRRTAFVGSSTPHRLVASELEHLVANLRGDLTEEQLHAIDKDLGRLTRKPSPPRAALSAPRTGDDPFLRANQVPVLDVLTWLGLLDGSDQPTCPGCGESDGSAVAIVGNGVKCLHNRCSRDGVPKGFRSVVDLVVARRKISPIEAVRELADRFGFEVAQQKQAQPKATQPQEDAPDIKTAREKHPALASEGAWVEQLKCDRYGKPKPTYGNLCIVLRNAYGKRLSFNEMRAGPCLDGKPLGDADVGRVREELERKFALVMNEGNVIASVRQVAEEKRFHPVRDYLRSLKWDVKVRLPSISKDVLGTDDPLHSRMVIAWFAQAAKRALEPGCKADATLVLVGDQGFLKSTFFAILAGQEWFSDTKMDLASRDGLMQLAAAWIYEWGEIDRVTSRNHASDVKQFTTSQVDAFRPPFGRAIIQHPRSSVIVGSTNEQQFLTDPTGSRRFWCVSVPRRLPDDALRFLQTHRDQLWAEAVVNVESGYQTYLTLDEELRREELAEVHQVADAFQDAIGSWLGSSKARALEAAQGWLTTSDILGSALEIDKARWDRATQSRVGHAMKRLHWPHARRRIADGRTIWVYLRPQSEPPGNSGLTGNGTGRSYASGQDPPECRSEALWPQ